MPIISEEASQQWEVLVGFRRRHESNLDRLVCNRRSKTATSAWPHVASVPLDFGPHFLLEAQIL